MLANGALGVVGRPVQSDRIEKARCDDIDSRNILHIRAVHLGRHITDAALDVPDALARAATPSEQRNVLRIGLRIVGAQQAQQRRLAVAVFTDDTNTVALAHAERHVIENMLGGKL